MTTIISTNTISNVGVAVSLTAFENYFITPNVIVGSTVSDAMVSSDTSIQLLVAGAVYGASAGIRLGNDGLDANYQIQITSTGIVSGGLNSGTGGVRMYGQGSVINAGYISGNYGVVIGSATATDVNMLTNTGTITGSREAIFRVSTSVDTLRVENHGSILAGSDSSYAMHENGTNAVEIIINRGLISGDLSFGMGDDRLDNRDGRIEGDVFMDQGVDIVNTANGILNGTVYGSSGNDRFTGNATRSDSFDGGTEVDTLDFRFQAAVTVALDGSFTEGGSAFGDTYTGFENVLGSNVGNDRITGNAEINVLNGLAGRDSLDGGSNNDILVGGDGVDVVKGGTGNDAFRFTALGDFGDLISDFSSAAAGNNDRFQFSAAGFAGLVAGPLAAADFQTRSDNLAQDSTDRFIFRITDKTLWFDEDGNGTEAAVMVADLQASATVTFSDIQII